MTSPTTNHTTITSDNPADYPFKSAAELVNELLDTLTLTSSAADVFVGQSRDYVGARIFGGQVLAQALLAASHTLPMDKPCHSMHGYFLRGGDVTRPVSYQVRRLRDGRSLSAREVVAVQYKDDGSESVIFSMNASFALAEDGLDYHGVMPSYPDPDYLPNEQQLKTKTLPNIPPALRSRFMRQRHVEIRPVAPRDLINPAPMRPKQAIWLRVNELHERPIATQQALLAFASDFYLVGTAMMPHGVSFMTRGLQAASIDHSIHFHRPFDMNDWLLYDMWSDTSSRSKGLNHGQFWQAGKLVATVQQEGLMRLHQDPNKSTTDS
ncbi:MAG: acyl-CoA thioesterase II [Moraxella sp.]|nr:acyl-CoA thioesterase II [Moraxella sp.]